MNTDSTEVIPKYLYDMIADNSQLPKAIDKWKLALAPSGKSTEDVARKLPVKSFLEAFAPHRMTKDEKTKRRKKRLKQLFLEVKETFHLTYDDITPHRQITAWRLIREFARIRGQVEWNESLEETLNDCYLQHSPWHLPNKLDPEQVTRKRNYSHYEKVLELNSIADSLADCLQEDVMNPQGDIITTYGLALCPPSIPSRNAVNGDLKYDQCKDERLTLYINIMILIAEGLGVYNGSRKVPTLGLYGMKGLTDPYAIRDLWPHPQEIIETEHKLVEEVSELLIRLPTLHVHTELHESYGFTRHESEGLIHLAKSRALVGFASTDEERALMVLKFEDLAKKAIEIGDIRAALAANKAISQMLGLDKSPEGSDTQDFIEATITSSNKRKMMIG